MLNPKAPDEYVDRVLKHVPPERWASVREVGTLEPDFNCVALGLVAATPIQVAIASGLIEPGPVLDALGKRLAKVLEHGLVTERLSTVSRLALAQIDVTHREIFMVLFRTKSSAAELNAALGHTWFSEAGTTPEEMALN